MLTFLSKKVFLHMFSQLIREEITFVQFFPACTKKSTRRLGRTSPCQQYGLLSCFFQSQGTSRFAHLPSFSCCNPIMLYFLNSKKHNTFHIFNISKIGILIEFAKVSLWPFTHYLNWNAAALLIKTIDYI